MATQGNDTSAVSQREDCISMMTKYGTTIRQIISQYKPVSPPKIISDNCYVLDIYRLKKKKNFFKVFRKIPMKYIIPNPKLQRILEKIFQPSRPNGPAMPLHNYTPSKMKNH